jgi:hypothetical protein
MEPQTCHQWLQQLDELDPPPEAWRDPDFCAATSWVMLLFLPRRMGQLLINAGSPAVPGTDFRELGSD